MARWARSTLLSSARGPDGCVGLLGSNRVSAQSFMSRSALQQVECPTERWTGTCFPSQFFKSLIFLDRVEYLIVAMAGYPYRRVSIEISR